jgi:translation initiation factor IF-3
MLTKASSLLYSPFALFFSFWPISKRLRVNNQIRVPMVRLIDDEGNMVEALPTTQALEMARQRELDLVEVAPNTSPPVCKLMDYGKYLYRQQKVDRKHRAQQKQAEMKGIRLGFRTGQHDLEVKANQARKFLEGRHSVKVAMVFRGREVTHKDLGFEKMQKFYELVKDVGKLDDRPKSQGNTIFMIISSSGTGGPKKPEQNTAPQSPASPASQPSRPPQSP